MFIFALGVSLVLAVIHGHIAHEAKPVQAHIFPVCKKVKLSLCLFY
jgi:hypothetical protein